MCFHIRKSADRSLFAAPRSLSQLVTSFIGSWCQGIRPMLLFAWTSLLIFSACSLNCWVSLNKFSSQQKSFCSFLRFTSRWNCNFFTLLGKTKLISQFCPLKSVRFLLILSKFHLNFLCIPIRLSRFISNYQASLSLHHRVMDIKLRRASLDVGSVLCTAGRSGWTRTIDLALIRRAL